VERRLAVHARTDGQVSRRRFAAVRRAFATVVQCALATSPVAVTAMVTLATSVASSAPRSRDARAQFDRGVAAYTKGDYATAAEALGASFVLEADPETLFAWAQTERKLGHCDRAVDLYMKLLGMDLPDANRKAVLVQIDECKAMLAEQKPRVEPPPPASPAAAELEPIEPDPAPQPAPVRERRPRWKDPVGGALVGVGAVGLGVGAVFLVQARNADADKQDAPTYPAYEALAERAEARGRLGVMSLVAGGALVASGVVWYLTRKPANETAVTTLVVPGGGGLALSGRF
jgi:tetratricopeptide (TPR) repeat protein